VNSVRGEVSLAVSIVPLERINAQRDPPSYREQAPSADRHESPDILLKQNYLYFSGRSAGIDDAVADGATTATGRT
jgi:hypothetical protein